MPERTIEDVRNLIKDKWILTSETSNRIYFKYKDMRGVPKFYFDKNKLEVIRLDKSNVSSKDAMSVEVKTNIYSLLDSEIKPVTATEVFSNRHTEYIEALVSKYNGKEDQTGGVTS